MVEAPGCGSEGRLTQIGDRYPGVRSLGEPLGAGRRFAEAIADPSPLYTDGGVAAEGRYGRLLAPPTFPRTFDYGHVDGLRLPVAGLIHGEFTISYERPLLVAELPVETVDAEGGFVVPGLIDPHEHLLGGSGESGFSSQTPEITLSEIVAAGITTVVGYKAESIVEAFPEVSLPAWHGRDVVLHRAVALTLGDLRVAAREQLRPGVVLVAVGHRDCSPPFLLFVAHPARCLSSASSWDL